MRRLSKNIYHYLLIMFPTSTQCKYWMFSSEEELNKLREKANLKHVQIYGKNVAVSLPPNF